MLRLPDSSPSGCAMTFVYYNDVIMGPMAFHITSLSSVYSTVYSRTDQRKLQSSASLAFVWEIQRRPVNSPYKEPVTRKMYPFDDVIMSWACAMTFVCNRRELFLAAFLHHYNGVIMSAMESQITGISSLCSTVCSGAGQRKHQNSASLAFVMGIHRWQVDSPHVGCQPIAPWARTVRNLDAQNSLKYKFQFQERLPRADLEGGAPGARPP